MQSLARAGAHSVRLIRKDVMGKIIFITGVPASGKSTIAGLIAKTFPKSVHLQVDKLREMMVNGIELPLPGAV